MRHINFASAPLSDADKEELARWLEVVQTAEAEARAEDLVCRNLRMAVKLACRYAGNGVPVSDLCQEASIALMRAAETHDASKAQFSTHASITIVGHLLRVVHNSGNLIRIPVHVQEHRAGTANDATRRAAQSAAYVESLDQKLDDKHGPHYARSGHYGGAVKDELSLFADPNADTAGEAIARIEAMERRALLARLLGQLNERERQAVELHLAQGMTFAECASFMGCSKQRVHQIIGDARRKMRALYAEAQQEAA